MKKRMGFVSNSSSTSFCIFGVYLNSHDFANVFGLPDDPDWDIVEDIMAEADDKYPELSIYYNSECDYNGYVGLGPTKIKDTETFAEFRIRVTKLLADANIGDKHSIEWHEDTIYG